MKIRLHLTVITFFILVMTCLPGCKKTTTSAPNNNPLPSGNGDPAVTSVGSPLGTPVSKSIGSAGGIVVSDDGQMQIDIPAGALALNTHITIQRVTNEMPGSIGSS